jgi:hypothetical protein
MNGPHKKKKCDDDGQKKQVIGFRDGVKKVWAQAKAKDEEGASSSSKAPSIQALDSDEEVSPRRTKSSKDQWKPFKGLRSNMKLVSNALWRVEELGSVDHGLSRMGQRQCRQLHRRMAWVVANPKVAGAGAALLECKEWYVSPFLRAIQTASFALSPLHGRNNDLSITITPLLNEFSDFRGALDCQGKRNNVGLRILNRAIVKTLKSDADEVSPTGESLSERKAELSSFVATCYAMNIEEVMQQWWVDPAKKGDKDDENRVRQMVGKALAGNDKIVGLVGHSLFFKRLLQRYWPSDPHLQDKLRSALRNGSSDKDPLEDKIMNCGVLVLQFKYSVPAAGTSDSSDPDYFYQIEKSAEVIDTEFLFDSHMEDAAEASPSLTEQVASSEDDSDVHREDLDSFLSVPDQRQNSAMDLDSFIS